MSEYTLDRARELIGNNVPAGSVPAAWWITTDPEQLAAYDRWSADYEARRLEILALAESIGADVTDARMWSGFGTTTLSGFAPPAFMGHWDTEHPQYRPVPDGWRIDKKQNLLRPARRTKADRESQINKDFNAVARIPDLCTYMTGMPGEIELRHPGGSRVYFVQYRRGDSCVMAFSGGDPDRQSTEHRKAVIDETVWHRH